ncbi:hypothetical protein F4776DRAFT_638969 [Hypoxylon sp. NC0597]|nr:hypothetical protein F4776DRAFT_638969 [Hypoxylon sp. NC0597]
MHSASRRAHDSVWCPSNRLYSSLAHGASVEEVRKYIHNIEDEVEHLAAPDPEPDRPEPTPRPTREREQNFVSIFRRGTLEGYTFDSRQFYDSMPLFLDDENAVKLPGFVSGVPTSIRTAAQELFSARHPSVISFLMENTYHSRMAYNLKAYGPSVYRRIQMGGISGPVSHQPKRTIEFRQAAGTVNPDEVIAHGKIVVRICEAALGDTSYVWKLILDCADAEHANTWYDVFDLLIELDLIDEARVIQRQMANERALVIKDEARGRIKKPLLPRLYKTLSKIPGSVRSLCSLPIRTSPT